MKISRVDTLLNECDLQDLEFGHKFRELKKMAYQLEKELELSQQETLEAVNYSKVLERRIREYDKFNQEIAETLQLMP